jgi:hypothetical protein
MARVLIKYDPSPTQERFHTSSAFKVLMLGGKGSGKTFSLVNKAIQLAGVNTGIDGGMLCPTLKMFRRDVYPTFQKVAKANNLPVTFNKSDYEFYFPLTDNKIYVYHSEDDGESIAGANLGWGVVNEVTLCTYLAYAEFMSRIRVAAAKMPQVAMSGTPEDLVWVNEEFFEKKHADLEMMFIRTDENTHNGPWYLQTLEETYDAQRLKAYRDGEMVLFNGRPAAWSFSRAKHASQVMVFDPVQVWVSLDFNVSPLAATIWYIPPVGMPFRMYARRSICIRDNATTAQFCTVLWENLHELGLAERDDTGRWRALKPVAIYPDPAGKSRSTKSHLSDIQILEEGGFPDIRYKKKITSVKDCLNAMNNLFDKGHILINPHETKELLTDLERVKIKEEIFELDKSDPKKTHWLDGLKDMCDYEFPVINPNAQVTID